jgi:hypothetical protein
LDGRETATWFLAEREREREEFLLCTAFNTDSGDLPDHYPAGTRETPYGKCGRSFKLTTDLRLTQILRVVELLSISYRKLPMRVSSFSPFCRTLVPLSVPTVPFAEHHLPLSVPTVPSAEHRVPLSAFSPFCRTPCTSVSAFSPFCRTPCASKCLQSLLQNTLCLCQCLQSLLQNTL